ncbi:MAG: hypothetical protein ACI4XI_02385 [Ruminococcus sp.]
MKDFIRKGLIIMSAMSLMFSLFGCSDKNKISSRPAEALSSVSISQNHMDRTYCYHFWAREENGSYLLDAECLIVDYDNNDYKEINFTDAEITEKEFKSFAEIDSKYDFCSHIKAGRKKNIFFACDETITNFLVKYGDESFNIETNGECFKAVNELFFQLAEKYADNND